MENPNQNARALIEFNPVNQEHFIIKATGKNVKNEDATVEDPTPEEPEPKNIKAVKTFTVIFTESSNPGNCVWIPLPGGGWKKVCY
ncbi:MAG: hypothetical protein MRK02_17830 [Candidatus Scalindua sp.]|nr:hypothetical protein [Candidatus Scalindua sp.]